MAVRQNSSLLLSCHLPGHPELTTSTHHHPNTQRVTADASYYLEIWTAIEFSSKKLGRVWQHSLGISKVSLKTVEPSLGKTVHAPLIQKGGNCGLLTFYTHIALRRASSVSFLPNLIHLSRWWIESAHARLTTVSEEKKKCVRYWIFWLSHAHKNYLEILSHYTFHGNVSLGHTSFESTTKLQMVHISLKIDSCAIAIAEVPPTSYQPSLLNSKHRFKIWALWKRQSMFVLLKCFRKSLIMILSHFSVFKSSSTDLTGGAPNPGWWQQQNPPSDPHQASPGNPNNNPAKDREQTSLNQLYPKLEAFFFFFEFFRLEPKEPCVADGLLL